MRYFLIVLSATIILFLTTCAPTQFNKLMNSSIIDNTLKVSIWTTHGNTYNPPEMPPKQEDRLVENWLIKKAGVQVVDMFGNGGVQWETKLSQLIADSKLPQLVHCNGGQGPVQFAKLASADLIWELDPQTLQMYAPNIYKKIPQKAWNSMKINGKIYGIPYKFPVSKQIDPDIDPKVLAFFERCSSDNTFSDISALWIRDDILQKLFPSSKSYAQIMDLINQKNEPIGDDLCDVPIKTTQDYIKLMYDIKALGLMTSNGNPVYATGYTGSDNWFSFTFLGAEMLGYR